MTRDHRNLEGIAKVGNTAIVEHSNSWGRLLKVNLEVVDTVVADLDPLHQKFVDSLVDWDHRSSIQSVALKHRQSWGCWSRNCSHNYCFQVSMSQVQRH